MVSVQSVFDVCPEDTYKKINRAIVCKKYRDFGSVDGSHQFTSCNFYLGDQRNEENIPYLISSEKFSDAYTSIKNVFGIGNWTLVSLVKFRQYTFALKWVDDKDEIKNCLVIVFGNLILYKDGDWTRFADDQHKTIAISLIQKLTAISDQQSSNLLESVFFDEEKEIAVIEEDQEYSLDVYRGGNDMQYSIAMVAIFAMIAIISPPIAIAVLGYSLIEYSFRKK